jgi:secreted PhoX family phosphatase
LGPAAAQTVRPSTRAATARAEAQEVQFGDNNDGMSLFAFPGDELIAR